MSRFKYAAAFGYAAPKGITLIGKKQCRRRGAIGHAVAKLVDAADQNTQQLSAAAEGLGRAVDVSA